MQDKGRISEGKKLIMKETEKYGRKEGKKSESVR